MIDKSNFLCSTFLKIFSKTQMPADDFQSNFIYNCPQADKLKGTFNKFFNWKPFSITYIKRLAGSSLQRRCQLLFTLPFPFFLLLFD